MPRLTLPILVIILGSFAFAQEDIEQYLLTDSLEIAALIDTNAAKELERPKVRAFTNLGLAVMNFIGLEDLNASFEEMGYGSIPEQNLAWSYGLRVDAGQSFSFGMTMLSNFFINSFNEGNSHATRLSSMNLTFDFGYRKDFGSISLVPALGIGFSQNMLSWKPNGMEEISWSQLHQHQDALSSLIEAKFALSTDLSVSKIFEKPDKKARLLNLKMGVLFHPFDLADPAIGAGDQPFLEIKDAPGMTSSGPYLILTWG